MKKSSDEKKMHDIRAQLAIITLYVELLQGATLKAREKTMLKKIKSASRAILRLLK